MLVKEILQEVFKGISYVFIDENNRIFSQTVKNKKPLFSIKVNDTRFYRVLLFPNALSLGEAYIYNDFNVDGDLVSFIEYVRSVHLGLGTNVGLPSCSTTI